VFLLPRHCTSDNIGVAASDLFSVASTASNFICHSKETMRRFEHFQSLLNHKAIDPVTAMTVSSSDWLIFSVISDSFLTLKRKQQRPPARVLAKV
jgi:hypothetical protein